MRMILCKPWLSADTTGESVSCAWKHCRIWTKFFLLGLVVCCVMAGMGCQKKGQPTDIAIHFFYNQPCGTCDGTAEFRDIFEKELGDIASQYPYKLVTYNTFRQSDLQTRDRMLREIGYESERDRLQSNNLMVLNGKLYVGMQEIEAGLRSGFLEAAGQL